MLFSFNFGNNAYLFDSSAPLDISIPLDFHGKQPNAFYLAPAVALPVDAGSFVGDTRRGGSCNCETVTLNPHGNGTHTECIGHIADERAMVGELLRESFVPAVVISVEIQRGDNGGRISDDEIPASTDGIITPEALAVALTALGDVPREFYRGLVIRTIPNNSAKRAGEYSGANPPYISLPAMRSIRELGVEHLLVDLPSVDREDDGGALAAHRIFWDAPDRGQDIVAPFSTRTITEMIYVSDTVADGLYLLDLQIPNFMLDAAPSRPLLFSVRRAP